jgi:hypothetical protein
MVHTVLSRLSPLSSGRSERLSKVTRSAAELAMNDFGPNILKQKLGAYAGSELRLLLVGGDPHARVLFEQLGNVFAVARGTPVIADITVVKSSMPSPSGNGLRRPKTAPFPDIGRAIC